MRNQYKIEDSTQINIKEYDFLIWHLNREELKKYKGCTIVDMPGFNSGIQEHNKAILRYAGNLKVVKYILKTSTDSHPKFL